MYSKEGLLKRLPKKYCEIIDDLSEEEGLIDDCRFIITLKEPHHFQDGGLTYPCRNYKEAIDIVRSSIEK